MWISLINSRTDEHNYCNLICSRCYTEWLNFYRNRFKSRGVECKWKVIKMYENFELGFDFYALFLCEFIFNLTIRDLCIREPPDGLVISALTCVTSYGINICKHFKVTVFTHHREYKYKIGSYSLLWGIITVKETQSADHTFSDWQSV